MKSREQGIGDIPFVVLDGLVTKIPQVFLPLVAHNLAARETPYWDDLLARVSHVLSVHVDQERTMALVAVVVGGKNEEQIFVPFDVYLSRTSLPPPSHRPVVAPRQNCTDPASGSSEIGYICGCLYT